ncbi:hypothetical protein FPJ27_07565 [Burkholderia sp. MS455]|uniref:Uncharacterized protein n=1 Tax=Burkholderia pyrrocinia TaxID=60550 RepID=A0A318I3M6_BURPY|nr:MULTISPECIES: hypothetical protein [Burkholderia]PXX25518.1 hypothetical protein NA66_102725 [Burkholderia pyrrocinia]QRR06300.1 hypothetical protein FPJ27_07565 [Burkholderia sp. MS455]SFW61059.1 hypothetical protein SAMN03159384_03206 [Burkholderia sp. NFACC33-1]SFY16841.1 hypothetical protein SAMN03159408_03417 [Burkholderia sp. NFPP32]
MGIQVVVVAASHAEVVEKLGSAAPFAEIFPLPEGYFGISVPFKVVDDIGEQVVLGRISAFNYFDLWAGEWKSPA